MVCAPVRSIIPSLKLGDYLSVQAHKPCSISPLLDIMLFSKTTREGQKLFYIVCRVAASLRDIPYSQKKMGMLSLDCRLVSSRTLRIITTIKSLYRLLITVGNHVIFCTYIHTERVKYSSLFL